MRIFPARTWHFKAWPYRLRFLFLVLVCVTLNLGGLLAAEKVGWSILFFDMAGTAVASMLSGATAGVLVALLTGWLGSYLLGRPEYALFGIVNVAGAVIWAVAPRSGMRLLGGEVFDPAFPAAYRRGMANILVLGLLVGAACAVLSWIVQAYVLNMKINGGIMPPDSFSGGTVTSINNINMALMLEKLLGGSFSRDIILLLASCISNVPDKIISTVSAVFLIFSFGTLPNYTKQKQIMRRYANITNCVVIDHRLLLIFLLAVPLVAFPYVTYKRTGNFTSAVIMFCLAILMLSASFSDRVYTRSIDRRTKLAPEDSGGLFFAIPDGFELKRQKDIFEDTLKMMVVLGSSLSFALAALDHSAQCAVSETMESLNSCGMLYRLAVVNILILTAYRYSFMILIRLGGRV